MPDATLTDRFSRDPHAVLLDVLRTAGEPVTARQVIDEVAGRGVDRTAVSATWRAFQDTVLKDHPNVGRPGRRTYEWRDTPSTDDDEGRIRAARERQLRIDALRAIAELAGEIEELAYNSGDADLIVERLRSRVRAATLEQIGEPGDPAAFDPARHEAIGVRPADGARVTVVRPGYAWASDGAAPVLQKAVVAAD